MLELVTHMKRIRCLISIIATQLIFATFASGASHLEALEAKQLNRLIRPIGVLGNIPMAPLINNGIDAIPGEFPWMVALTTVDSTGSYTFFCGGTLISPKVILTAAHCEKTDVSSIRVLYGNVEWMQVFSTPITVKSFLPYPNYQSMDSGTDIAVIILNSPINKAIPIKLKVSDEKPFREGQELQIMGWGNTIGEAMQSETLQKGYIKVYSEEKCSEKFGKNTMKSSLICAGGDTKYAAACRYDSGGPAVVKTNGQWEQVAVISFGARCRASENIAAYTKITPLVDEWISTLALDKLRK